MTTALEQATESTQDPTDNPGPRGRVRSASESRDHLPEGLRNRRLNGPRPTLIDLIHDPAMQWQAFALCKETDPEVFYPETGQPGQPAKRICRRCTVQSQCLEYALAADERFGIWGGLSEADRRSRGRVAQERALIRLRAMPDDGP